MQVSIEELNISKCVVIPRLRYIATVQVCGRQYLRTMFQQIQIYIVILNSDWYLLAEINEQLETELSNI